MSTVAFTPSSSESGSSGSKPAVIPASISREPQNVRVLIVEDEWFISMEIEAALEDAGYAIAGTAVSAQEAVNMVEMHHPDLVLMDIRLQGNSDGIEAAIEIKRRHGIRCLFVSAHVDAGTLERAQPADPLGWLTKPFSSPQLVLAVEKVLLEI